MSEDKKESWTCNAEDHCGDYEPHNEQDTSCLYWGDGQCWFQIYQDEGDDFEPEEDDVIFCAYLSQLKECPYEYERNCIKSKEENHER
jgi:hypothetical protein